MIITCKEYGEWGGGISINAENTAEANGLITHSVSAVAYSGSLTTRTDYNTGVITLDSGHAVTTGTVCVFFSGGYFYDAEGVVTGDSLAVDEGIGSVLPSAGTAVTVCNHTPITTTFDADEMKALFVDCDDDAIVMFDEGGIHKLVVDRKMFAFVENSNQHPFPSTVIDEINFAVKPAVVATTVKIGLLLNTL